MMKIFFLPLLLVPAACGGFFAPHPSPPPDRPPADPYDRRTQALPTILETRGDVDRYGGQWIKVVGRFEPMDATAVHAQITLDSGLVILIPDFDRFKAGDDWLKYNGKRVAVGGTLVSYPHTIGGRTAPSIVIDHFEALEPVRKP